MQSFNCIFTNPNLRRLRLLPRKKRIAQSFSIIKDGAVDNSDEKYEHDENANGEILGSDSNGDIDVQKTPPRKSS